ncbi:carbohydrate kinase [uncultured Desulfuromusa sp.]|uniref:carbohydrate kinase family protein n=1 Tax=uncultured Desulfuromusa sp. TaxID=219183 RepID=UPI002AA6FA3E|nr:carbohydrate kinase [uncultured Desulfuromusa sp.]
MSEQVNIYIFGEVLFDCFPTGEQVLGGAPFNVAWHLQALGDSPQLISRVGKDQHGDRILQAMSGWGLKTSAIQVDSTHPTGRVEVSITDNEPSYTIVPDSAFDFISLPDPGSFSSGGILYHGTLSLRNETSRKTLLEIVHSHHVKTFFDVNLRFPWWHRDEVCEWLKNATWVKMNQDELTALSNHQGSDIQLQMAEMQETYGLEQLIVTRGEQGALIRTAAGKFHSLVPGKVACLIDTVGAGDAFSAIYLHALRGGWSIEKTLYHAQCFAGKVVGLRGATTNDPEFYQQVTDFCNF